jgi:hypothetical protein
MSGERRRPGIQQPNQLARTNVLRCLFLQNISNTEGIESGFEHEFGLIEGERSRHFDTECAAVAFKFPVIGLTPSSSCGGSHSNVRSGRAAFESCYNRAAAQHQISSSPRAFDLHR